MKQVDALLLISKREDSTVAGLRLSDSGHLFTGTAGEVTVPVRVWRRLLKLGDIGLHKDRLGFRRVFVTDQGQRRIATR